ncbi:MAG TPA: hypothetical protein VGL51_09445 [Solirubrobacteraceae bacterium]|jgi:hypothetical protein
MRRTSIWVIAVIVSVVAAGFAAYAGAATKTKKRSYTVTLTGATIGSHGNTGEAAYKVRSSLDGAGAALQEVKVSGSAFPLSGTDTVTTYYANGVAKAKDKFTLSALDANGISKINGSGKCVGGTRVHKNEKCKFTFSGTYNSKTTVVRAKIKGTDTR